MADPPTLGFIVPAYRPDLELLVPYLEQVTEVLDPAMLRVELDAPGERTRQRLAGTPATVAVSARRRGKGAAIADGFDALNTDVLAFADADAATPVPELGRIVDAVLSGNTTLAVGSRRHPDATVETGQSLLRGVMGDGFAWLARRLLDVSLYDYQCGAKALTAGAWRQVREDLTEEGFAVGCRTARVRQRAQPDGAGDPDHLARPPGLDGATGAVGRRHGDCAAVHQSPDDPGRHLG